MIGESTPRPTRTLGSLYPDEPLTINGRAGRGQKTNFFETGRAAAVGSEQQLAKHRELSHVGQSETHRSNPCPVWLRPSCGQSRQAASLTRFQGAIGSCFAAFTCLFARGCIARYQYIIPGGVPLRDWGMLINRHPPRPYRWAASLLLDSHFLLSSLISHLLPLISSSHLSQLQASIFHLPSPCSAPLGCTASHINRRLLPAFFQSPILT
ncbi:hypothetical protein V8C35DRAFT_187707 [Trichoderma chlorosporum]